MYIAIFPCQIHFLINRFCFKRSSNFNMEITGIYKCLLFDLRSSKYCLLRVNAYEKCIEFF